MFRQLLFIVLLLLSNCTFCSDIHVSLYSLNIVRLFIFWIIVVTCLVIVSFFFVVGNPFIFPKMLKPNFHQEFVGGAFRSFGRYG